MNIMIAAGDIHAVSILVLGGLALGECDWRYR